MATDPTQWAILAWTHLNEDGEWTVTENTIGQGAASASSKGYAITWDSAGIVKFEELK